MLYGKSRLKIIEDRRMQNIVFTNDWHQYFQRFGLRTIEDFYNLSVAYKPNQIRLQCDYLNQSVWIEE